MFKSKFFFIALLLLSVVLFQNSVCADSISIPGYHEILFSGTTSDFSGIAELPVANSSSIYTPAVGDSISIYFGATFYDDTYGSDDHYYTWNHDDILDIFQIIVNDGINGYVIDIPIAMDDNGYASSFRDTFWITYDTFYRHRHRHRQRRTTWIHYI